MCVNRCTGMAHGTIHRPHDSQAAPLSVQRTDLSHVPHGAWDVSASDWLNISQAETEKLILIMLKL